MNDFEKQTRLRNMGCKVLIIGEYEVKNENFYNIIVDDIRKQK